MVGPSITKDKEQVKVLEENITEGGETAIEVKNVKKLYRLYPGQRARVMEWLTFGKKKGHRPFWALDDVSFALPKGQALGIIGPNGSGKSTLLKLISQTSYATEGEITVNGKVAALLELGAGFHGEFTGRQNIRMNAQIFGLTEEQIDGIMDDIIMFSELDHFIDMPVKTYSSGMYARLGFSVACHLDPDILIVDEALSVGDTYFQRKSLDRIIQFREKGKTILFVSHTLPVVQRFCDTVIWLHDGKIREMGPAAKVIKSYDMWTLQQHEIDRKRNEDEESSAQKGGGDGVRILGGKHGTQETKIIKVEMFGEDGVPRWHFEKHEKNITIRMHYHAFETNNIPIFGINFHNMDGIYIFGTANYHIEPHELDPLTGYGYVDYKIKQLYLHKGTFFLSCGVYDEPDLPYWGKPLEWHVQMYEFAVLSDGDPDGIVPFQGQWHQEQNLFDQTCSDVPTTLDFSKGSTNTYLQWGWYDIEETPDFSFAWTKKEAHFIILQESDTSSIEIQMLTNKPDINTSKVDVSLWSGDELLDMNQLENHDWNSLIFKLPPTNNPVVKQLKLVTTQCWKPSELGNIGDDRDIGVGVRSISTLSE